MLTVTCPQCLADLSLPPSRLILRLEPGVLTTGELLFTCLSCHATVASALDTHSVATALAAGVTHVMLSDEVAADG